MYLISLCEGKRKGRVSGCVGVSVCVRCVSVSVCHCVSVSIC
jgi:hypothetical protein